MKFDTPAGDTAIDRLRIVGKPVDRVDGPLKTTGLAPYAYEQHAAAPDAAYGYVVASAIAKGRIKSMRLIDAERAPGVIAIVTWQNAGKLGKSADNYATLLGGPTIEHYHQAIAVVVAETFEQARAAARLVRVDYDRAEGRYDLAAQAETAPLVGGGARDGSAAPDYERVGDFDAAFAAAAVKIDSRYTTPDQSHAMMEPHASIAVWQDGNLTLWTSSQIVAWHRQQLADTLLIPKERVHIVSPYIGGGFGAKLRIRSDALMAALAARAAKRPVKVTLARAQIVNNTVHRPATIQRVRIGAGRDGRITAIAHESLSGNLAGGRPETATTPTRLFYAGANRLLGMRLATLDLPEGSSMRAPGEAPGLMALEIAMDEAAEALNLDPVEFRIRNDTQTDPRNAARPFSYRNYVGCLRTGAERFGWDRRSAKPAQRRDGRWLIGMGVAGGIRNNLLTPSAARVRLDAEGIVTVETDMTDIGTGSYTIIAQTAAEMMGVPIERVVVRLGDSTFPVSCGSGGQWGGNNATAGVYAACVKLREMVAQRLGLDPASAVFADGKVQAGGRRVALSTAVGAAPLVAEDGIEYGDIARRQQQSTFVAHFAEVAVDVGSGETHVRRLLAVCSAGRILNPKTARSQVIGAMTMGIGAALMEEAVIDQRFGLFVNHDMASYEVPVHADIPHLDVVFLDETDPMSSPMKAKGVGELGICGVGAAVANAIYNATGVRVRDYPVTLDKLIDGLPELV